MSAFSDPACLLVEWSQGTVGTVLAVTSLLVGSALYWRYRWAYAIVLSLVIALACYFEPEMILSMFNITPQACQSTYENFVSNRDNLNLQVCDDRLAQINQPGEYCACEGDLSSPTCVSDEQECDSELSNSETATNSCECSFANQTNNPQPDCQNLPAGAKTDYTNSEAVQCGSTQTTWGQAPFCKADIPQDASFIYPVPDSYDPSKENTDPHAYYTMQTEIDNPTNRAITVTWYETGDDVSWLYFNGAQVDYNSASNSWTTMQKVQITLEPGENTLDSTILNYDQGNPDIMNPTGTINEVIGPNNTVLSASGNSNYPKWYEVSGPPAAPNPPPPTQTTDCYTESCGSPVT